MNELLEGLGIKRFFSKNDEFKGIFEKIPLFIGKIKQNNYINVKDEGTQASSIAKVDFVFECSKTKDKKSIVFITDRPFAIFLFNEKKLPKGYDIIFFSNLYKI